MTIFEKLEEIKKLAIQSENYMIAEYSKQIIEEIKKNG